jgi:hypothetical protein
MADLRPFANMSQEDTSEMMLLLLAQIVDKLPRLDVNDRALVNVADAGNGVSVSNSLTVASVNGFGASGRIADAIPFHMSGAGTMHLYNQIKVSN